MSETNLAELKSKTSGDRTLMHVLYGLHTLSWFSAGAFTLIALTINHIRCDSEDDAIYKAHHNYMVCTFWWTLLWLALPILLGLLLMNNDMGRLVRFLVVILFFYGIVFLWYLYRYIRGWIRFSRQQLV